MKQLLRAGLATGLRSFYTEYYPHTVTSIKPSTVTSLYQKCEILGLFLTKRMLAKMQSNRVFFLLNQSLLSVSIYGLFLFSPADAELPPPLPPSGFSSFSPSSPQHDLRVHYGDSVDVGAKLSRYSSDIGAPTHTLK